MAVQKKVDLNEPLDVNVKPTLSKETLKPSYAEAALRLHGDYYRQSQGKCNRYIFWHPFSLVLLVGGTGVFMFYKLFDYMVVADSVGEFLGFFLNNRDFQYLLTSCLPTLALLFGLIGGISFFMTDSIREVSNSLAKDEYMQVLFGFDLRKYAKLPENPLSPKDKALMKNGENTQVLLYRESPIAVLTLKPLFDRSSPANFMVKITGLNVKKVFSKVDFETLLIQNALIRAREIFQGYVKDTKDIEGCKINILIDAYSFDAEFLSKLKLMKFSKLLTSYEVDPFKEDIKSNDSAESVISKISFYNLRRIFGISRDTYGVTLLVKNADEDLILKAGHDQDKSTVTRRKPKASRK